MTDTNRDELVLTCPVCGHTEPCPTTLAHAWPTHCGGDMLLANTTTRDGDPIDRAKTLHPIAAEVYESELP